jgi:PAS domain S-box-containing protein
MELSPDAMVLTDDSGRIVSLNPAAKQMFGYEIRELAGEPLMLLLSSSSRGPPRDAVAQALEQPTGATSDQVMRLEGVTREGRVFPVELSLSHWRAGRLYVAVTLRAATERGRPRRSSACTPPRRLMHGTRSWSRRSEAREGVRPSSTRMRRSPG